MSLLSPDDHHDVGICYSAWPGIVVCVSVLALFGWLSRDGEGPKETPYSTI